MTMRVALERAAGDGGADVARVMQAVRQRGDRITVHFQLVPQVEPAGVGHGQVGFHAGQFTQQLQQAHAIHRAAGARDGDDDAARRCR